ncbi:MAG: hypothetical protein IJP90_11030, partial [Treponema sp.]|nr:hypothetical protein [Treponema sp.]
MKKSGMSDDEISRFMEELKKQDNKGTYNLKDMADSMAELPPEIRKQYYSGELKYTGQQTTANLEGAADVNLHLTLDDNRTKVSATTSRNTARNIRVNTGSVIEAREML